MVELVYIYIYIVQFTLGEFCGNSFRIWRPEWISWLVDDVIGPNRLDQAIRVPAREQAENAGVVGFDEAGFINHHGKSWVLNVRGLIGDMLSCLQSL